jgi:hypothetical protein
MPLQGGFAAVWLVGRLRNLIQAAIDSLFLSESCQSRLTFRLNDGIRTIRSGALHHPIEAHGQCRAIRPKGWLFWTGKGTRPIYPDQSVPEPAALKR